MEWMDNVFALVIGGIIVVCLGYWAWNRSRNKEQPPKTDENPFDK